MVLARRGWVLTTSVLLAATTRMPAPAQDEGKAATALPTHLPTAKAPATGVVIIPAGSEATTLTPAPESVPASGGSWGGCGAACTATGQGWGHHHARYEDPPLGAFLYAHYRTHVANGEAARMILYDYDFIAGSNHLNPRGQQQLAKI